MVPDASLVGRESELGRVVDWLTRRRLVTLVGPGGIGKTALARAAGRAAAPLVDAVHTVDLTLVDDPDGVRESLAAQLGFSSFPALVDAPGDDPVLVLVDNCEHVLDAVAEALAALLDACTMPKVLATSRAPLGIPEEIVVPIGPLELPASGDLDSPATRLFLERAQEAGASIDPSPAVAALCRRLDGIPLALELAAARARSMSPDEMLHRLDDGLDLLHRPRSRRAPRHRSLSATIEWSHRLLDPADQELFADLSVFAGPFSATAAHAVAGAPGTSVADTEDHLDVLVDASMIVAEPSGGSTRYRILDTIRAWGRERLDRRGRRDLVVGRFVDHVVDVATGIIERGAATWSSEALADLLASYTSIATAIRWCLRRDEQPDRAVLLTAVLWGLVHQAHTEEIGDLASAVVDRWATADHPLIADAVSTATTCRYMLGDLEGAVATAREWLVPAERSPFAPATLRRAIAQSLRAQGDTEGAMAWFAETATSARRLGLMSMATEADSARAQVLADIGRLDEALDLVSAARREAEHAGSEVGVAWATAIHGSILLRRDAREAERVLLHALELARDIRYEAGIGVCLRSLALAALLRSDLADAASRTTQLLDDLLARGSTYELRMVLELAAPLLERRGQHEVAADLAATALSLPVVSITASVGHELFPLVPATGRALATRDAIRAVRDHLGAPTDGTLSAPPDPVARAEVEIEGVFRPRGDSWEIGFGSEVVSMRASKGLADLATLIASAHREVHCLDLMGAGVDQSDTGPVLDAAARRAYEDHLRDLRAQLDEAEDANDLARAERARHEMDLLVDQLTQALALGGRARTTGSTTERARSAITQRIRATLRRIDELHPTLGRHLAASVRTGTWCSYAPERPVRWDLGEPR